MYTLRPKVVIVQHDWRLRVRFAVVFINMRFKVVIIIMARGRFVLYDFVRHVTVVLPNSSIFLSLDFFASTIEFSSSLLSRVNNSGRLHWLCVAPHVHRFVPVALYRLRPRARL